MFFQAGAGKSEIYFNHKMSYNKHVMRSYCALLPRKPIDYISGLSLFSLLT